MLKRLSNLLNSKKVVFVTTTVAGIDRGWDYNDVITALLKARINLEVVNLDSKEELLSYASSNAEAIFWPVCYTLFEDEENTFITEILHELGAYYIGASSNSLIYSSKIKFKQSIDKVSGIETPAYHLIESNSCISSCANIFTPPIMLKTEYSCNSEGVRRVNSYSDFEKELNELHQAYGQKLYVEKWERNTEYTVAYIPETDNKSELIAPVGLSILSDASFIDIETKAKSKLVRVEDLGDAQVYELKEATKRLVSQLKIDGHCRIDFIRNIQGELFVIEINFQPYMSISEDNLSYFPNALRKIALKSFDAQLHQIFEHALERNYRVSNHKNIINYESHKQFYSAKDYVTRDS